jgi:hypothetical protein
MNRAAVAIGLLVVLMMGVPALSTAFQDSVSASQPGNIQTETATVSPGDDVQLGVPAGVALSNTVNVTANGTTYRAGEDYRYNARTATVSITTDTSIPSGTTTEIAYRTHQPSQAQRLVAQISRTGTGTGEVWGLFAGVGIVVAFVSMLVALGRGA